MQAFVVFPVAWNGFGQIRSVVITTRFKYHCEPVFSSSGFNKTKCFSLVRYEHAAEALLVLVKYC